MMKRLALIGCALAVSMGTASAQTNTQTGAQSVAGQTSPQTGGQNNNSEYTFLVASGFLCNAANAGVCPAVARSANGDAFEFSGAGMFNARDKSAKAFGVFNHRSANGELVETGVWSIDRLVSFESYGVAPAAMAQWGPAVGRPQFGPRRPGRTGRMPSGGLAVFHIVLAPVSGVQRGAELKVNCALGMVPQERAVEGVGITIEKENVEYAAEAGGRVIFLLPAHGARVPVRNADDKAAADASGENRGKESE